MPSRSALAACIAGSLLSGWPRQHLPRAPTWQRDFHLTGPAAIARVKPENAAGRLGAEELRFLEEFNHLGDSLEHAGAGSTTSRTHWEIADRGARRRVVLPRRMRAPPPIAG